MYYIYIFLRILGTGYASNPNVLASICALILMTLYRCQGTTTTARKTNCMPHNATLTCSPTTAPLGKLHIHVVDVLSIYPYHSVNSIDTWYLVRNMKLVLYLVSPGPLASVYLIVVSLFRCRFIVIVTDIIPKLW